MTAQDTLQRTPLYNEHVALNARMVSFGGWEMPLQYEGILAEYTHTRKAVTIFDTSHMGEFVIEGGCLESGLDRIVSMRIADMPLQSCRYGMMLNEEGGVMDDLIVFREDAEKWFIVVNGATTPKDARHFRDHLKQPHAFKDISSEIGKIDVQGPRSREILAALVPGIQKLSYYTFDRFNLSGETVRISRTGYTGELGYEIYSSKDTVIPLWWELLKNAGVKPAGLGARDMLRLEAGYSLYGHELDESITPLEAGLQRFVDWTKDFIGKDALLKQQKEGAQKTLVGIISQDRRSPRQNQKLYGETGEEIGYVTSGTFSPFCQRGIGVGFVQKNHSRHGQKVLFGEGRHQGAMTGKTFYKNDSFKN